MYFNETNFFYLQLAMHVYVQENWDDVNFNQVHTHNLEYLRRTAAIKMKVCVTFYVSLCSL